MQTTTLLEPLLEMLLVDICAWALPSTTTTDTNKAANNRAEDLPIMSDRTLILFLRVNRDASRRDGLTNVPGDLSFWKEHMVKATGINPE